ncbi:CDP-diacylglycerol--glycerol-3-phosphate 3-phosphatidyltransferase [Persephonella sp.]|uniref:CDP-diacylglycerol--glycerol-3-phosphate 3-phosphatidyltransferase n=1 Tax=Persephonella sp. TaxID=2060922 RepID=UPI0025D82775|nr:CDP-diacylglycerol--glycerol-3-phosphate 3-phosphatidyltransferase [Persephonella sp.]
MGFANQLTILRIFLIPVFIILIGYNKPLYALIVFIIAGLTDALDGFIARKFNQITTLGKILDPIADKALLVSGFIFIYTSDLQVKFPYWYVVIVISRDIYILLGSALIYFMKGYLDVRPSVFGKATTFFQILSVVAVLVANITYIPQNFVDWIIYTASFFTVLSTITYTYDGFQQIK